MNSEEYFGTKDKPYSECTDFCRDYKISIHTEEKLARENTCF